MNSSFPDSWSSSYINTVRHSHNRWTNSHRELYFQYHLAYESLIRYGQYCDFTSVWQTLRECHLINYENNPPEFYVLTRPSVSVWSSMLSILWDSKTERITAQNGIKCNVLISLHWCIKCKHAVLFVFISWRDNIYILVFPGPVIFCWNTYRYEYEQKWNMPVRKQLLVTRHTCVFYVLVQSIKTCRRS